MGLIKISETRRRTAALTAAALLVFAGGGLYARAAGTGDGSGAGQLGPEITRLEGILAGNIPAAERHAVLVRLARLRQLSGNVSVAADLWLQAAALNPADDFALVSGAYGLAAVGEWERALATIQPLLASGRRGPSALRARYLDATLRAWTASDISRLVALAADPEAAVMRPIIYYTLWWTESRDPVSFGGNAEVWRRRLLTEFPQSPEARIAVPEASGASPEFSAIHSPLWLLLPGGSADSVFAETPVPARQPVPGTAPVPVPPSGAPLRIVPLPPGSSAPGSPVPGTPVGGLPAPGPTPPPVAPQPPAPVPAATHGRQTGLFRSETNARNQAESLRNAGFPAVLSRRIVNGAEHWAVVVPVFENAERTARELSAAGYDSFTVRLD